MRSHIKFAIIHTPSTANEEVSRMFSQRLHRSTILSLLLLAPLALLFAACGDTSSSSSTPTAQPKLQRTFDTSDGKLHLQLTISPDQPGNNTFTVMVSDAKTGKAVSDAHVQLFTTMLDMAMGTDSADLQSSGNGQYTTQGQLSMSGDWQIGVQVRTSDSQVHKAQVKISTTS
jgi:hypothetical protein